MVLQSCLVGATRAGSKENTLRCCGRGRHGRDESYNISNMRILLQIDTKNAVLGVFTCRICWKVAE